MKHLCSTLFVIVLLLLGSQVMAQTEPNYRYNWLPDDSGVLVLNQNLLTLYDPAWQPIATRPVISDLDTTISLAPDGHTMLVRNGGWEIWDIRTLQTLRALPIDPDASDPVWSVDGSTITFRDAGQVGTSVYDSQTGAFIRRIPGMFWGSGFDMIWSADRNLVFANALKYILLLDPNSGIEVKRIAVPDLERMSIYAFDLSHDGQRIALSVDTQTQPSEFESSLFLLDPTSETFTPLVQGLGEPITYILWGEQDSEIVAITNTEILIVDTNGTLLNRFPRRNGVFVGASYSQFGGQLRVGYSRLFDSSSSQVASANRDTAGTSQFSGLVQVIVPDPSPARLASIAAACNAPQSVTRALPSQSTDAAVARFETALAALPGDAIPPACEADLRAVAEALAAQP